MATILTAINQQTEWFDLRGAATPINFSLDGDFIEAVSVQYSNDDAYLKDANSITTDPITYTSKTGPLQFPFAISKFVRFTSGGSWTAGKKCTPRFSVTRNASGGLYTPAVQTNIPPQVTA